MPGHALGSGRVRLRAAYHDRAGTAAIHLELPTTHVDQTRPELDHIRPTVLPLAFAKLDFEFENSGLRAANETAQMVGLGQLLWSGRHLRLRFGEPELASEGAGGFGKQARY